MIVIVVSVVAGTTMLSLIAWMYFRYLRDKHAASGGASSLTTSELELMLRRVVEESNAPLRARIEDLEAQLETEDEPVKELPAHKKEPLLDEPDGPRDLAALPRKKSHAV